MAYEDQAPKAVIRRLTPEIRPGEPLRVSEPITVADGIAPCSSLSTAMALALRAYLKAARDLLDGRYAGVRDLAPPHLRSPCHCYVVCCPDGVLVRYDATEEEPKVRSTDCDEPLSDTAPKFSEYVVHLPDDPETYVPAFQGPGILRVITNERGEEIEQARLHPIISASKTFPPGFAMPVPPERPPCLVSFHRELDFQIKGAVTPLSAPGNAIPTPKDQFIARGVISLPVGWQAIEVYPRLSEDYWKPEYAPGWAHLDLLNAIAQRNMLASTLHGLDGRREAREQHASLLQQLGDLLQGPEEPCHKFLKANPALICPTHDGAWSKVAFGKHVSDFVFREPRDDYLLVEIEAPGRKLFRDDGQPSQELNHAINQIDDWLRYIQDNKSTVERELCLTGISATPRTLVIIGRSATLTDDNKQKLTVIQGQRPKLSILTYDDLLDRAQANLERLFGPLSLRTNMEVYFYRDSCA